MKFGVDATGNYGYIKDGADTVTPFSNRGFVAYWNHYSSAACNLVDLKSYTDSIVSANEDGKTITFLRDANVIIYFGGGGVIAKGIDVLINNVKQQVFINGNSYAFFAFCKEYSFKKGDTFAINFNQDASVSWIPTAINVVCNLK